MKVSSKSWFSRVDDRGVSEVVGAILVFALLLLVLVLAQVALVPVLNQQVEAEHSQRVGDDVAQLEGAITRVGASGVGESADVEVGVDYPDRPLLLNPPPAVGTLQTTDGYGVALRNVTVATNDETADWWNGADRTYDAVSLRHQTQYNEYRDAGDLYLENGVRYRVFEDGTIVVLGDSGLVDGRQIEIVTLTGDLTTVDRGVVSLPLSAVSGPPQTVGVTETAASGEPVTIVLRTRLSAATWADLLSDEIGDPADGNYVREVRQVGDDVAVVMHEGVTYDLRLSTVGVGTDATGGEPAYLTDDGRTVRVPTAGGDLSVLVRDANNNPVSGVEVTFATTTGTVGATTATSDADGRAVTTLSGAEGAASVTATIDTDGGVDRDGDGDPVDAWETVSVDARIGDVDGGDDDGKDINPNEDGVLVLAGATTDRCNPSGDCRVSVLFENAVGSDVTIDAVRVNVYAPNAPGASGEDFPDEARLLDGDTLVGPTVAVGGPDVSLAGVDADVVTVPAGADAAAPFAVEVRFFEDGDPFTVPGGDVVYVTVSYTTPDGPQRSTYLISTRPA